MRQSRAYILFLFVGLGLFTSYQNFSPPAKESSSFSFLAVGDIHYGYSQHHRGSDYDPVDDPVPAEVDKNGQALRQYTTEEWNAYQVQAFNTVLKYKSHLSHRFNDPNFSDPRGLIILGDLTDDGQEIEMAEFTRAFGLNGNDSKANLKLQFPVIETSGNHDYPKTYYTTVNGKKVPVETWNPKTLKSPRELPVFGEIHSRNKTRSSVVRHNYAGYYAIRNGHNVLVQLGVMPSDRDDALAEKEDGYRYTPAFGALTFLKSVLEKESNVDSKSRFVISFHYPLGSGARISRNDEIEFFKAIDKYNVVAILHAHKHSTDIYRWCGIPVFNIGSPLMSWAKSKTRFDSSFAIFDLTETHLKAMTVSWNFASATENLAFGQESNCNYSDPKESRCWEISLTLASIARERKALSGKCDTNAVQPLVVTNETN